MASTTTTTTTNTSSSSIIVAAVDAGAASVEALQSNIHESSNSNMNNENRKENEKQEEIVMNSTGSNRSSSVKKTTSLSSPPPPSSSSSSCSNTKHSRSSSPVAPNSGVATMAPPSVEKYDQHNSSFYQSPSPEQKHHQQQHPSQRPLGNLSHPGHGPGLSHGHVHGHGHGHHNMNYPRHPQQQQQQLVMYPQQHQHQLSHTPMHQHPHHHHCGSGGTHVSAHHGHPYGPHDAPLGPARIMNRNMSTPAPLAVPTANANPTPPMHAHPHASYNIFPPHNHHQQHFQQQHPHPHHSNPHPHSHHHIHPHALGHPRSMPHHTNSHGPSPHQYQHSNPNYCAAPLPPPPPQPHSHHHHQQQQPYEHSQQQQHSTPLAHTPALGQPSSSSSSKLSNHHRNSSSRSLASSTHNEYNGNTECSHGSTDQGVQQHIDRTPSDSSVVARIPYATSSSVTKQQPTAPVPVTVSSKSSISGTIGSNTDISNASPCDNSNCSTSTYCNSVGTFSTGHLDQIVDDVSVAPTQVVNPPILSSQSSRTTVQPLSDHTNVVVTARSEQETVEQKQADKPEISSEPQPQVDLESATKTTSAAAATHSDVVPPSTEAVKKQPQPVLETPCNQKRGPPGGFSFKSPITLCFERMLGAADMISSVKRPVGTAKLSEKVDPPTKPMAKRKLHSSDNDDGEEPEPEQVVLSSASGRVSLTAADDDSSYEGSRSSFEHGRVYKKAKKHLLQQQRAARTDVPSPCDKRDYLDEGNPFLEIEDDLELHRKVVLKMALQRQLHDESKEPEREVSNIIQEGFFWRDYPPCEQVLYDNMADYYEISSLQRQSKLQQAFNNLLVQQVRKTAEEAGLQFDCTFNEKKLRDRIRCFYKTHLQNAKKRLATLQKHPYSDEHQTALRVYIRCVQQNISVDDSQRMEPSLRKKYQRQGTVPVELPTQATFRVREKLNESRLRL